MFQKCIGNNLTLLHISVPKIIKNFIKGTFELNKFQKLIREKNG